MDCLLDNPALCLLCFNLLLTPIISDYTFNRLLLAQAKHEVLKLCPRRVVAGERVYDDKGCLG